MAKTKEELDTLKTEVEAMNKKLSELTDEELNIVTGGLKQGEEPETELPVQLQGICPKGKRLEYINGCAYCECLMIRAPKNGYKSLEYCSLGYGYIEYADKM